MGTRLNDGVAVSGVDKTEKNPMNADHDTQLPSTSFMSRDMDGEDLAQLHQVLEQVEQGRGTLVRLADLMGGAVAGQLSLVCKACLWRRASKRRYSA